jgi:hypothetical protein
VHAFTRYDLDCTGGPDKPRRWHRWKITLNLGCLDSNLEIPVQAPFHLAKGIAGESVHAADRPPMRLQRNKDPQSDQQQVCDTIAATIEDFRARCDAQGVTIETDISDCLAIGNSAFVKSATAGLISNALCAMPAGGELSLTLIDSAQQWELEVADSGPNPSRLGKSNDLKSLHETSNAQQETDGQSLPRVIEFPATEALRDVIRLAHQHRASVESFSCPLGGTAWVMAVSKYRSDSKTGTRAA